MNLKTASLEMEGKKDSEFFLIKTLYNIKGIFTVSLILINTIIGYPFLLTAAFIKLLVPIKIIRKICTKILIFIAETWINNNILITKYLLGFNVHVTGDNDLSKDGWYFVISNHQSWVDIMVLQKIFNRRIPLLKFFLKKELIWVPLLGIAWWALDFPFMQRHSAEAIKKNPSLKG